MLTFYKVYPKASPGKHLPTNPVESPFAALRLLRTRPVAIKKVENACFQAVIWKMLLVAEQRFRRLRHRADERPSRQGAK